MKRDWMVPGRWLLCGALVFGASGAALAQTVSHRGFIDGTGFGFPQETPTDSTRLVADLLAREEVTVKPARSVLFDAGMELRANSHDQVEDSWRVDYSDRGVRRPRVSLRRVAATLTRGPFSLDVGKQFVRWGKTDIVVPTDRFAPRDYLDVIDPQFIAITAVRGAAQAGRHTIDVVWSPRFTPSRIPLVGQRWVDVPPGLPPDTALVETPPEFPRGSQGGIRWGQVIGTGEFSISVYRGFNHLPDIRIDAVDPVANQIQFSRVYQPIRSYGADAAFPLRWFTLKGEAAYFSSSSHTAEEYLLYVVQLERQRGEWVFVGGYVGEVVTREGTLLTFAPDRGLSRAIVARAAYTIDPNRRFDLEGAVRVDDQGMYAKAEYSQARGQHLRFTIAGVLLAGDADDFLGQYRRNSHLRAAVRYSF